MYKVKEIYYTIQGEGYHTGRPAVFCRFSGCNLWSGREVDRATAQCTFCDTDFWGMDGEKGGSYTLTSLTDLIESFFPKTDYRFVVFTGGEPALQLDEKLINELHKRRIEVAIETNGTLHLPKGIDWICVSPKSDTEIVVRQGHELKLVFPQLNNHPRLYESLNFDHFYLQPLQNVNWEANTEKTIKYCKENPRWKLSVQSHKYLDIP